MAIRLSPIRAMPAKALGPSRSPKATAPRLSALIGTRKVTSSRLLAPTRFRMRKNSI
jgi:hypothetical protein